MTLVLTAHGSIDPRSAANAHAVAAEIASQRPGLDVRVAFLERSAPHLRDVLTDDAVVVPFLLADAYHAQVDIPAAIDESGARRVRRADVLGEDPRLLSVLRDRLTEADVSLDDSDVGVVFAAVGSSRPDANRQTACAARAFATGTAWHVGAAFVTGPRPTVPTAVRQLRRAGARRVVVAPWFLAPGTLTDRLADVAAAHDTVVAPPLGAHPLVAATVLDRYDSALRRRAAA